MKKLSLYLLQIFLCCLLLILWMQKVVSWSLPKVGLISPAQRASVTVKKIPIPIKKTCDFARCKSNGREISRIWTTDWPCFAELALSKEKLPHKEKTFKFQSLSWKPRSINKWYCVLYRVGQNNMTELLHMLLPFQCHMLQESVSP